jgi:hypothetical protein
VVVLQGDAMKMVGKLGLALILFVLALVLVGAVRAQAPGEETTTFLDTEVPGIKIQVNATAQTQPTGNLTVTLSLRPETAVHIEYVTLEIFGFMNGTFRLSMLNMTYSNVTLGETSEFYNSSTVNVPNWVWGVTYGEVRLTYNFIAPQLTVSNITTGFVMTYVENTYLIGLEDQVKSLNQSYQQLSGLYSNLTAEFNQLNESYYSAKGSLGDLDNTRRVTAVLAVTTIVFLVTTVYLVVRRPRESW